MYIKDFNSAIFDRTVENGENIVNKLFEGDVLSTQKYLSNEFVDLFEDLFFEQIFADVLYEAWLGDKWNSAKKAVGQAYDKGKQAVGQAYDKGKQAVGQAYDKGKQVVSNAVTAFKNAIQQIFNQLKNTIKNFSIQKLWNYAKKGFTTIKKAVFSKLAQAAECLRLPLIDLKWVDANNKFQVKTAYSQIMAWTKSDKKLSGEVDVNNLGNISSTIIGAVSSQQMQTSLNDSIRYTNDSMGLILEATTETIEVDDPKNQVKPGEKSEHGTKLTEASMKTGSYGFFKKILFKMGVKEAKANSLVSIIMNMVVFGGIFALLVMPVVAPFLATVGAGAAAATAGIGVAGSVVIILIAGVLLSLGLFMVITWVIKPYPNINDLRAYLEAWFRAYPDGIPGPVKPKNLPDPGGLSRNTHKEGMGKYEDMRLKKDDTCRLLSKWHKLFKIEQKTEQDTANMQKVLDHLLKRTVTIDGQKTQLKIEQLQDPKSYQDIWNKLGCTIKKKKVVSYGEYTNKDGRILPSTKTEETQPKPKPQPKPEQ